MSNPSKSFLHSDDQQAGQVQKVKKVIQVQYYSSESQGAASVGSDVAGRWWRGQGHDMAHGALCRSGLTVLTVLYGAGRRGGGVAWRGLRSRVGWVLLASWRVGGHEVLRAVLYDEQKKKKKKKKGLNEWCWSDVATVLANGTLAWWWHGAVDVARAVSVAMLGRANEKGLWAHSVGAGLLCGEVLVVEVDGDGGPQAYGWRGGGDVVCEKRHEEEKKKYLPISSSSARVLGGFARRGDDGGELEVTAGVIG
ncbi:hypothetical protein EDB83DRAFT_2317170 [Lactarius deliciosus]|nr:hypothetical protein EDB83DRAFT_2317170 [Lactarius deliciosus]